MMRDRLHLTGIEDTVPDYGCLFELDWVPPSGCLVPAHGSSAEIGTMLVD